MFYQIIEILTDNAIQIYKIQRVSVFLRVFCRSHLMMTSGTAVYSEQSNICARRPVITPQTTTSCTSYKPPDDGDVKVLENVDQSKTEKLDQWHQVVAFKTFQLFRFFL